MAEQLTLELLIERPDAPASSGRPDTRSSDAHSSGARRFTAKEQQVARLGIARARQALAEAAAAGRRERAERARRNRSAA